VTIYATCAAQLFVRSIFLMAKSICQIRASANCLGYYITTSRTSSKKSPLAGRELKTFPGGNAKRRRQLITKKGGKGVAKKWASTGLELGQLLNFPRREAWCCMSCKMQLNIEC